MFRLMVIQALHGDCLILEGGSRGDPKYLLIDGGPSGVYKDHLKKELAGIQATGGKIHLAMLSHVDDDHVNGLLDLLNDLVKQRRKGQPETIAIGGFWHNSFSQTAGATNEKGLSRAMEGSPLPRSAMPLTDLLTRSISQGSELAASARGLQIPINAEFRDSPDRVVCVDNLDHPILLANLKMQVVGPTRSSLQDLKEEWEQWLAKQKKVTEMPVVEAEAAARALDESVPNLSSIMLLVKAEGKTVLLTGDGRGDQLLEGLKKARALKKDGTVHVNVFKLPHHGSARNITQEVFERITADTYVICANGKYDNPDFQTLEWLVQAAQKQNRSFSIVATNETKSIQDLVEKYNPETSHYKLAFIEPGAHSITIDLG